MISQTQEKIRITFNVENTFVKNSVGKPITSKRWENIVGVLDFKSGQITCEIEAEEDQAFVLFFSQKVTVHNLSIEYNGGEHPVDLTKCEIFPSYRSGFSIDGHFPVKITFQFGFRRSILTLRAMPPSDKYRLVFSGARGQEVKKEVKHKNQCLFFESEKHSDILTVTSAEEISEDTLRLIFCAYSLYQNAEISLRERQTPTEFQLFPQMPEQNGTLLCDNVDFFLEIWNWLSGDDFLAWVNRIQFFLAGTRTHGANLDFRLINLFICLNSICNGKLSFGENIATTFNISKGDGHWLAYVRNALVHEGVNISYAISSAFKTFDEKQRGNNHLTISRYATYQTSNDNLPFALYCDVIDLIMEYFVKKTGYSRPVKKMSDLYKTTIPNLYKTTIPKEI